MQAGYQNNNTNNTFSGYQAGYFNAGGHANTFLGKFAGRGNKSGHYNVCIGADTGPGANSTGSYNVFLGYKAGWGETGSNKLYITSNASTLIKGDFAAGTLNLYANVGIGGTTSSSYKLHVGGSAYSTGNWTSSDRRYKKDIQTIDSALDKVNALNGVTYSFKPETINDIDFSKQKGEKQIGFVAQELEEVLPELVRKDEAGYYAVNYDGLVPVLVEAVKEQQDEITDLRTRLEKLEALLNDTETIQGNLTPANDIDFSGVVLRQNAPNPFRGSITIEYQLPENINTASLVVSDLNGRTVATYNIAEKGTIQFDAAGLDSGMYVYAIIANGQSIASQKMVIQK